MCKLALTAGAATFTSSSSARGGNLVRLKVESPEVTVGNILGVNIDNGDDADTTPGDPLNRKVEITPAKVYPGEEDHRFTITFTAPGPMDSSADANSTLIITVPTSLQPDPFSDATIRVLGRGGADIDDDSVEIDGGTITVPLTAITTDQTVVVTYTIDEIPTAEATATSAFSATTTTVGGGTGIDVTTITGGLIGAVEGSGRMQISPASVENGDTKRDFTLTYTAYTAVTGSIQITPAGIVLDDADDTDNVVEELHDVDTRSGKYGYVSASASPSGNSEGALAVDSTTGMITLTDVNLAKNAKLTTTIRRVHVTEDAGNYEWDVHVVTEDDGLVADANLLTDDPTTADVDEVATLTVVNTEPGFCQV